jgi:hypothetical protein
MAAPKLLIYKEQGMSKQSSGENPMASRAISMMPLSLKVPESFVPE